MINLSYSAPKAVCKSPGLTNELKHPGPYPWALSLSEDKPINIALAKDFACWNLAQLTIS